MVERQWTKEEYLLLAKLSQQTERYKEMLEYMRKIIKLTTDTLKEEERSMLSAAYKSVIGNLRAELRVLRAIEEKEKKSATSGQGGHETYIASYRAIIEEEMSTICEEILNVLETKLIPKAQSIVDKIFYLKMKADYNRYLSEIYTSENFSKVTDNAEKTYTEAYELAAANLESTNPVRLGVDLNRSVFLYEMQKIEEAIDVATKAFDEAIANIDNVSAENYKDCTLIIQLLRDNLTLWTNEQNKSGS